MRLRLAALLSLFCILLQPTLAFTLPTTSRISSPSSTRHKAYNIHHRFAHTLTTSTSNHLYPLPLKSTKHNLFESVRIRGGASSSAPPSLSRNVNNLLFSTPQKLYTSLLTALILIATSLTLSPSSLTKPKALKPTTTASTNNKTNSLLKSYLPPFVLIRLSDWLLGPYFHSLYTVKSLSQGLNHVPLLYLTGFLTTFVGSPILNNLSSPPTSHDDEDGNMGKWVFLSYKQSSLLSILLGGMGSFTVLSSNLKVLYAGRVLSGLASSLIFSSPEAWLCWFDSRTQTSNKGNETETKSSLKNVFPLLSKIDSITAISSGILASKLVKQYNRIEAPFVLSGICSILAFMWVTSIWNDDRSDRLSSAAAASAAVHEESITPRLSRLPSQTTLKSLILLTVLTTSIETSIYTFVLLWPSSLSKVTSRHFASLGVNGGSVPVPVPLPFGLVFSSLMASCYIGSSVFGLLSSSSSSSTKTKRRNERLAVKGCSIGVLSFLLCSYCTSAFSSTTRTSIRGALPLIVANFIAFEWLVGFMLPLLATLRSKYLNPSPSASAITITTSTASKVKKEPAWIKNMSRQSLHSLTSLPMNLIISMLFYNLEKIGTSKAFGFAGVMLGFGGIAAYFL